MLKVQQIEFRERRPEPNMVGSSLHLGKRWETRYNIIMGGYLDGFNGIFNLEQAPFWGKRVYSAIVFTPL